MNQYRVLLATTAGDEAQARTMHAISRDAVTRMVNRMITEAILPADTVIVAVVDEKR